jgi:ABC-type Co2+ transport system permease subunit
MVDPTAVLYSGMLMAVALGMTAWRLASGPTRVGADVDRVLAICVVSSIGLFIAAVMPEVQLPGPVFTP